MGVLSWQDFYGSITQNSSSHVTVCQRETVVGEHGAEVPAPQPLVELKLCWEDERYTFKRETQ